MSATGSIPAYEKIIDVKILKISKAGPKERYQNLRALYFVAPATMALAIAVSTMYAVFESSNSLSFMATLYEGVKNTGVIIAICILILLYAFTMRRSLRKKL